MLCLCSNVSRRAWINRNANGASAQGHMIRAFPLTPQSQKQKKHCMWNTTKKPGDIICKVCYQFQQQSAKHWASPHFKHCCPYLLKCNCFNQHWITWVCRAHGDACLCLGFHWTSAQSHSTGGWGLPVWAEKIYFVSTNKVLPVLVGDLNTAQVSKISH